MSELVRVLTIVSLEEVIAERGNGGVQPEVGEIRIWTDGCDQMDVAFVRFTLIDEPDPPLT